MKYKCIIICNDKKNVLQIEALIKIHRELKHLKTFNSLTKAVRYFNSDKNRKDLAFIHINSTDPEDMNMTLEIKNKCKYCVCFSEQADYAKDAYDVGINDFLQTPIAIERFNVCIDRMLTYIIKQPDAYLLVRHKRGDSKLVILYYKDISVIESDGNYVVFITKDSTYTKNLSISAIEKDICSRHEFMKIHKSFIISTHHIEHLQGMNHVKMKGKKELISISNPYRNKFKASIGSDAFQLKEKTHKLKLSAVNNQPR